MIKKNNLKKRIIITITAMSLLLLIVGGIYMIHSRFSAMTPDEIMEKIVKQNENAIISVGIWQDGKEEKYLYTAHGREDFVPYTYQIGSITKTFTGAMIAYEEAKGNIDLMEGDPSLDLLVTHKSGFSDEWEQEIMIHPEKSFSREDMYAFAEKVERKEGTFEYSNFGSALAGTIVAEIYGNDKNLESTSYQDAMNDFIVKELGLEDTKVGGLGDFKNNYKWNAQDEMLGDGAITSNVSDLLKYGQLYLSDEERYDYLKNAVKARTDIDSQFDIGMFWIIERSSGLIWHNGEIDMEDENEKSVGYQSFIGISPKDNKVVVILSNTICNTDDETAYTDIMGYLIAERTNASE